MSVFNVNNFAFAELILGDTVHLGVLTLIWSGRTAVGLTTVVAEEGYRCIAANRKSAACFCLCSAVVDYREISEYFLSIVEMRLCLNSSLRNRPVMTTFSCFDEAWSSHCLSCSIMRPISSRRSPTLRYYSDCLCPIAGFTPRDYPASPTRLVGSSDWLIR